MNLIYETYVKDAINKIAKGDKENGEYKRDSQFYGSLLRGIWKKHYFQPDYEIVNLKGELDNPSSFTNKKIERFFKEHDGMPFSTIRSELINLLSLEYMQNRYKQRKVTGEWILYTEYEGKYYVLTFASHREGRVKKDTDPSIRRRLDEYCFREYPMIKNHLFPNAD